MTRHIPPDPSWDYWARGGTDGRRRPVESRLGHRNAEYAEAFEAAHARPVTGERRNGLPVPRPYVWRRGDAEREAHAAALVAAAKARVRAIIAGEIRAGCWWVPAGFTEADLDELP